MSYSKEQWRGIMQSIVESAIERDYDEHPYDEHGGREPAHIYWSSSILRVPMWPPGQWDYDAVIFEPDPDTGFIGIWGGHETADFTPDEFMKLLDSVGYSWVVKLMRFAKGESVTNERDV